jgi:hypothetical protein
VAKTTDADRILFVQAEDQIQAEVIYAQFDPWYQEVFKRKDAIKLKPTRRHVPRQPFRSAEGTRVGG